MAVYRAMLILSGPPGVGKTSIGRICAELLGLPFVDSDAVLSAQAGMPLAELMFRDGEAALRERELAFVHALDSVPCVLSVGGGLVTSPQVRARLRKLGFVCGLDASIDVLLARLAQSPALRPLLLPDPKKTLPDLLVRRESAYRDVDVRLSVDALSAQQAAAAVVSLYRQLFVQKESFKILHNGPTSVHCADALPTLDDVGDAPLLVYDQRIEQLAQHADPALLSWLHGFPQRYGVCAGEDLKDLAAFPKHVEHLLEIAAPLPQSRLSVVALGGGSVGDFAGFFASVFKRGVPLQQIPSTWLAAIDSAHGGKNALNVGRAKNQIGTIVSPTHVWITKRVLDLQPEERAHEAMGELAKIAYLDGGEWVQGLLASQKTGAALLWEWLPAAISAKRRIVELDPQERLGIRHKLNLGHTVGHVLETVHGLPHGLAVAQGLYFALSFSTQKGLLQATVKADLEARLRDRFGLYDRRSELPRIPQAQFVRLLAQDKKRSSKDEVRFVFLRAMGQSEVIPVTLSELTQAAIEMGYVEPQS